MNKIREERKKDILTSLTSSTVNIHNNKRIKDLKSYFLYFIIVLTKNTTILKL